MREWLAYQVPRGFVNRYMIAQIMGLMILGLCLNLFGLEMAVINMVIQILFCDWMLIRRIEERRGDPDFADWFND
jgi:hypothetical protein